MPKSVRGALKIRRMCRKKIHERITAVSGNIHDIEFVVLSNYVFYFILLHYLVNNCVFMMNTVSIEFDIFFLWL